MRPLLSALSPSKGMLVILSSYSAVVYKDMQHEQKVTFQWMAKRPADHLKNLQAEPAMKMLIPHLSQQIRKAEWLRAANKSGKPQQELEQKLTRWCQHRLTAYTPPVCFAKTCVTFVTLGAPLHLQSFPDLLERPWASLTDQQPCNWTAQDDMAFTHLAMVNFARFLAYRTEQKSRASLSNIWDRRGKVPLWDFDGEAITRTWKTPPNGWLGPHTQEFLERFLGKWD